MQCEEISHETGCWLYLAAHHPNAGGDFIHYASARLVREGSKYTDTMHASAKATFTGLKLSRRRETAELAGELVSTKSALEDAEKGRLEAERGRQDALRELERFRQEAQEREKIEAERVSLRSQLQSA